MPGSVGSRWSWVGTKVNNGRWKTFKNFLYINIMKTFCIIHALYICFFQFVSKFLFGFLKKKFRPVLVGFPVMSV